MEPCLEGGGGKRGGGGGGLWVGELVFVTYLQTRCVVPPTSMRDKEMVCINKTRVSSNPHPRRQAVLLRATLNKVKHDNGDLSTHEYYSSSE